tara:strand:+ start:277 stop:1194 length:918 start_codon:yes stop_codon:yes gene_type:complete
MHTMKFPKFFLLSLILSPFLLINFSCSNEKKSREYENLNLEQDIVPSLKGVAALGQLSPAGEVRKLASPVSQFGTFPRVIELFVKEGDYVEKDTVLATFENREKLKSDLQKKESLLETNDLEISLKEDQLKRFKLAIDKNAYSEIQFSQRKDELLKLKKQKIINLADRKAILIDLSNSQLRSPINGYILSINTRVGERSNSDGVLDIGASQNMEATIEVYESDIDRVFLNQSVELTSENGGFEDKLFGFVVRINPRVKQRKVLSTDPTGDADARVIEVLVKLNQESIEKVKSFAGMKVIARFIPK